MEDGDLYNMIYDELRGNLIVYEQNYINRYHKEVKKKTVAFNATPTGEKDILEDANSEGMTLTNSG